MSVSVGRLWDILSDRPEADKFKVEIRTTDGKELKIDKIKWDNSTKKFIIVVE